MISACNPGESPAIANTPNAPATPQAHAAELATGEPVIAKGVPHSGIINEVAMTEQADAALSFDNLLGIRLWPSLDGSRPPVPVSANAPRELALAHSGHDLLAVILDDAGAVQAMRLGLDGAVRGRASLPGQYKQAVATEAGVIVRTPDHAVEWYAPDGTFKGRVVAEPGQEIQGITTRNGHTAALLANASTNIARNIRWLTLGESLGWGMNVEVPGPVVDGMFALSPNNRRIAYVNSGALEVYEIDPFQRILKGEAVIRHMDNDRGIGFIDDDHAVLAGISQTAVWEPAKVQEPKKITPENDPWAVPTTWVTPNPAKMSQPSDTNLVDGFAYGNSVVVTGMGANLAVSTQLSTRYLGWKQLATGNLSAVGDQIVMGMSSSRFAWLDESLQLKRDVELYDAPSGPWVYGIPVGDHHLVTQTSRDGKYEIALQDVEAKARSKPIVFTETERLEYSPATQMFAIGQRRKINRYKLDLAKIAMTALTPIKIKGSPVTIRLYDPEQANGVTAAVIGWDSDYADYQTLTIYRAKGKPTRIHPFDGQILSEDADGTLYVYWRLGTPELRVMKDGKVERKLKLDGSSIPAITKDGKRLAYLDGKGSIIVMDGTSGESIWKQPMWGAQQVLFTGDSKKLVVRAIGGVASFDATTGIRTGLECGWKYGIYDDPLGSSPPGQSLVCEDPMLQ
jgi:hypothetical protein